MPPVRLGPPARSKVYDPPLWYDIVYLEHRMKMLPHEVDYNDSKKEDTYVRYIVLHTWTSQTRLRRDRRDYYGSVSNSETGATVG